MKRFLLIVTLIAVVTGITGMLLYGAYIFIYSNFIQENNEIVEVFSDDVMELVIEDEIVACDVPPEIIDNEILLPLEIVKEYFDPYIHWDKALKKVTITTDNKVIRMKTGDLEAYVNNEPITLNIPVLERGKTVMVPIDFLSEFYNIDIQYLEEDSVIIIDYKNSIRQIAEPIDEKAVVRTGRSKRSPIVQKFDLENGDPAKNRMRVFKEYDKWYKVRTASGKIGYIEKKYVVVTRVFVEKLPEKKKEPVKPFEGKISLVWDAMYGTRPDLSKINIPEGLDVVSPTWFQLENKTGNLINRAYKGYVDWAHEKGYAVWALLSNDFNDPQMTHEFLSNTDYRDNLIRQVLAYAALYELDGINIDFENVNIEDRDLLTQFAREITPLLHEQGLVVSMAVGVPDGSNNYSRCYDHEELGKTMDYIMLMTYDQHWATSPVAGSVAEYVWVEDRIKRTLEMVPNEKLLMGLPFYVRIWTEDKDNRVSSVAVSMDYVKRIVSEKNVPVVWDEKSGQFYAEFVEDGNVKKIWIEDETSIDLKSSLVHKYKLAGSAAWVRGLESEGIWPVLNRNLKLIGNYFEWKEANNISKVYAYR